MKAWFSCVMAFGFAQLASAHYTWNRLIVNGKAEGDNWQYIREHTRGYMPTFPPEAETSNDFRCNKDAASGQNTDVFTVKPGDDISVGTAFNAHMGHPGPV